jgi:hypothetical protein
MATLNENIATVKQCFSEIKNAVNVRCAEYLGDDDRIKSRTPVVGYAGEIYGAIADIYAKGAEGGSGGDYDEGFEAGKQEVISNSKYIPKTVTGKVISLTDVSEVAHKVKVYGDGQEVEVYGKNLFDISTDTKFTQQEDGSYVNNTKIAPTEIPLNLPYGKYVISYDLKCAVGRNARIRIHLKDGTTTDLYQVSTNEFLHFEHAIVGEIVAWTINYSSAPLQGEVTIKDAQIEVGSVATPYEPYTKQTITATPEGTEIDSMCPVMNFIADEDITVDYYSSFGMAEKELAMWNAITNFGAKSDWRLSFSHTNFSGYTIPTGLCRPTTAIGNMFAQYRGNELPRGVDCSGFDATKTDLTYHCYYTFASSTSLKHIYDMGIPAVKSYDRAYYNCTSLVRIEIIRSDENSNFSVNCFNNCPKLTHVIFSGVIASDINLQWSKLLDDESLVSISVALCDLVFSGFGDGWGSRTLTLSAESIARLKELPYPPDDLNPEGTPYAENGESCYTVIVSRKGWNIA